MLARSVVAAPETRLLLGLIALAAALRFATLSVQSLDADEGFTAEIARKSFGDALSQIPHTESSPPLYYVVVWGWAKLFGSSEAGLRSLSALAGTAFVPVVYAIGATLRSARVGLVAAALAAVSPLLVWSSQDARGYMAFALLATVAFWAFLRALREPRWLTAWALAGAAALATHYFAAVTVVPEAVWLLLRADAPRRRVAAAVAVVVAVAAALLPLLLYQSDHVSRPWANALSVSDELLATSQVFLVGNVWTWVIHRPGVIVLAAIALALAALAYRHERRAAALPVAIAAVALLLPFLGSLIGPKYLTAGNELAVWPLLALVLALGATRRTGIVLAAAAVAVMLAITLAAPLTDRLQRENWRDLVASLNDARTPRAVEVLNRFQDTPVIRYYLERQAPPAPVREVAVVGRPTVAPRAYFQPPAPGAAQVSLKSERKLAYARYATGAPVMPPGALYQR